MKQLTITHSTPRMIPSDISFSREPFGAWFFAYFFAITSFGVGIIGLYIMPVITILLWAIAIISIYRIIQLYRRKKNREDIFRNGAIVSGKIKEWNKVFSPFKSRSDCRITIIIDMENKSQEHHITTSHDLSKDFPVGNNIIGLFYNNQFLFPVDLELSEFTQIPQ